MTKTIIANGESLLLDTDTEDGKTTDDTVKLLTTPIMIKVRMENIYLDDVDALSRYIQVFKVITIIHKKGNNNTHNCYIHHYMCIHV